MAHSRLYILLIALLLIATRGTAATPDEIEAALKKGVAALQRQYRDAQPGKVIGGDGYGIGPGALAGLALLEAGTPVDDPAVKSITAAVRDAAFSETRTYQISLCLLYLDRFGDAADEPLMQMLGVRLLAGQNANGGWTYACIDSVSTGEERYLRRALTGVELKAGRPAGFPDTERPKKAGEDKPAIAGVLHPEVEKYSGRLAAGRAQVSIEDNSNTQFAILGVWAARKHGVPVEAALDLIEKRFLATQFASGGWPYALGFEGSPSMTCAGLLGLATAIGRREERRLRAEPVRKVEPIPAVVPKPAAKIDDPFFNPPEKPKAADGTAKKTPQLNEQARKGPLDARDVAVERALTSLGRVLALNDPRGVQKGRIRMGVRELGNRDFYFYWSLERVGVVYGLDKIGGVDWYNFGAEELVRAQHAGGAWGKGDGTDVDTAFAILFLSRSNLVRDLSTRVQGQAANTELRGGPGPESAAPPPTPSSRNDSRPARADPPSTKQAPSPARTVAVPPRSEGMAPERQEDPKAVAAQLVRATDAEWEASLKRARDERGSTNTYGLVAAIHELKGDRQKAARDALAERLTRMTPETLHEMARNTDAELRRGAVLAMAMKDDRTHIPDLIAALVDEEELVVRAARAGLKSMTNQDFGPAPGAKPADRALAAKTWLDWYRKQK